MNAFSVTDNFKSGKKVPHSMISVVDVI